MSLFDEYWIGKDIDLESLWNEFDRGHGYIKKVSSIDNHLLRLRFSGHPTTLPLFDHEVIYKTVKGTFHDVKKECLSEKEYNDAAPIFLYRIERGSGIFEFLAQFDPLATYIVALRAAMWYYRKAFEKDLDIDEKKLKFIEEHFHGASDEDKQSYMKAWTTFGRRRIMHRMMEQGLHSIEYSKAPFDGHTSPDNIEIIKTDD